MKKFTLFLASLFLTIGAMAQISALSELDNSKAYLLKNANDMGYAIWKSGDNLTLCGASSTYTDALDATDAGSNWQIISYKGEYYLYNIGAKRFAVTQGGPTYLTETPTAISIVTVTKGFAFNSDGNDSHYMCASHQSHHSSAPIQFWYSSDNGSAWQIIDNSENITEGLDALAKVEEHVAKYEIINTVTPIVEGASDTRVGAYTPASVTALSEKLETYKADMTEENHSALEEAYNELLANGEKVVLLEGEKFTVKCVEDSRGYMVYSTVEGKGSETQAYLAGTSNTNAHASIDAEGVYKEWALLVHNGKNYIYNVQKKQFINSEGVVKFTETPCAFNLVSIENNLWEMQFEDNNRYLSFSPGWGADCVRTEPTIDNGCKFYIDKTGESVSVDVLATVEATFVNAWKDAELSTLDYVGGYPSSLADAINAVMTVNGATEFDNANAASRVQFAPGYYFVKQVKNGKYASYNANGKFATEEVENLSIKHVLQFVQDGENLKLHVPNLGKNVQLENAAQNGSAASSIVDGGSNFAIVINNSANVIIKGDGQPMRTEGNGAVNYWSGEVDATWNIIPATEVEISINEFASIYLPFAVRVEGATAYAVEETTETSAIFAEKADIPANQGAILEGNGTATLTIIDEATTDWTNNMLEGSTVDAYLAGPAYVLSKPADSEIGFYKAALNKNEAGEEGTTHFKNNANKAYLVVEGAELAAYSFRFPGTTGIEEITVNREQSTVIYDLTGRRVEAITAPGIYIVNGVKRVVR